MARPPVDPSERGAPIGIDGARFRAIATGILTTVLTFSAIFAHQRLVSSSNWLISTISAARHSTTAIALISPPHARIDLLPVVKDRDNTITRIVFIDPGGTDELGIARGQTIVADTSGKSGPVGEDDRSLAIRANGILESVKKQSHNRDKSRLIERTDVGHVQAAAPVITADDEPLGVIFVDVDPTRVGQHNPVVPGWLAIVVGSIFGLVVLWFERRKNGSGYNAAILVFIAAAALTIVVFGLAQSRVDNHHTDVVQTLTQGDNELLVANGFDQLTPPPGSQDQTLPDTAENAASSVIYIAVLVILAFVLLLLQKPTTDLIFGLASQPGAYAYVLPALVSTLLLVFVPFAAGIGLAFFDAGRGDVDSYRFVGLGNFIEILFPPSGIGNSFYFTLGVTLLWTATNVFLHVVIGLSLALLLNRPNLRFRGIYRVLLIIPWAVPSYITALIWKGMFNYQYGAINKVLSIIGISPINWFGQSFWTNFFANLATNVWLGFPFMMVVSLGALQSIPRELYEAASIDGASKWQQLQAITLPLLKPALFPAILLGTIWTFNMFNVIYLVSAGGPDNQTNILITEAFYQFKVLGRYGFAAAYSIMIFLILLAYAVITNRVTKATEGSY